LLAYREPGVRTEIAQAISFFFAVLEEETLHIHTHVHTYIYTYIHSTYILTGCPRRNVRDFGRVFLTLNYTDITQNTYVQS
jgi:hypothetical protein